MYIVYDKETTRSLFWQSYGGVKTFKTLGAAKGALTREAKKVTKPKWGDDKENFRPQPLINKSDYKIAECQKFSMEIEKTRTVKNLLSGKEFDEPVNTPGFMSPSTETYHSM
jgi:hypothetical protein